MRKRPGSVYDKWNIPVVICDTYFITVNINLTTRNTWFSSFLVNSNSLKEILIGTTSSGKSYHLRDIYFIKGSHEMKSLRP